MKTVWSAAKGLILTLFHTLVDPSNRAQMPPQARN
jgi:hypothetical protein